MFADMPLDNLTVDQFAALTAVWLFQVFLKLYHRQKRSNISPRLIVL